VSDAIRALPTRYAGHTFRSRLEARWAVYFDRLGLLWEYEREGYDLGPLGWYLPDFWLGDVDMWAEVKPALFTQTELARTLDLSRITRYPCVRLVGAPGWQTYFASDYRDWIGTAESAVPFETDYVIGVEYAKSERRFFASPGDLDRNDFADWFEREAEAAEYARAYRFDGVGQTASTESLWAPSAFDRNLCDFCWQPFDVAALMRVEPSCKLACPGCAAGLSARRLAELHERLRGRAEGNPDAKGS
jgi:hypothetical protein